MPTLPEHNTEHTMNTQQDTQPRTRTRQRDDREAAADSTAAGPEPTAPRGRLPVPCCAPPQYLANSVPDPRSGISPTAPRAPISGDHHGPRGTAAPARHRHQEAVTTATYCTPKPNTNILPSGAYVGQKTIR